MSVTAPPILWITELMTPTDVEMKDLFRPVRPGKNCIVINVVPITQVTELVVQKNVPKTRQHPAAVPLLPMTAADIRAKAVILARVIMTAAGHGNIAAEKFVTMIQAVAASFAKAIISQTNAMTKTTVKAFTATATVQPTAHRPVRKAVTATHCLKPEKAGSLLPARPVPAELYIITVPKLVRADIQQQLIPAILQPDTGWLLRENPATAFVENVPIPSVRTVMTLP